MQHHSYLVYSIIATMLTIAIVVTCKHMFFIEVILFELELRELCTGLLCLQPCSIFADQLGEVPVN